MRYKKSILPNELNDVYHPKTQFSITLPRKKLDLNTFTLYYNGNPAVSEHIITFNTTASIINVPTNVGTTATPINAVDTTQNTITIIGHGITATIAHVIYNRNGHTPINPLVDGNRYILKRVDANTVEVLNPLVSHTYSQTPIGLNSTGGAGTHSFTLMDRYFKTIPRHFPRLSSCILSQVSIAIDNKTVQILNEYNTLQAILNDIQKEYDDIHSTSSDSIQNTVLNGGVLKMSSKILPYSKTSSENNKYFSPNKNSYFISNWLGFLGEGSRYFDATDKEVKITFTLAPPSILYKGLPSDDEYSIPHQYSTTNTTPYSYASDYEIYDVKATIDVLDDIPAIDNFVFKDYNVQQGSYLANNKKCLTSLSIDKPVEYVLGTFKQPNYLTFDTELQLMHCNTNVAKFGEKLKSELTIDDINSSTPKDMAFSYEIAKLQKDPYVLNSSYWFSHSGDGVLFTKFKYNTFDITPQMDLISCYNETKKCFNTDFKRVQSILGFESDFFVNAVRVDDNSSTYKTLEWEVEVDTSKSNTKGGVPMLFCCYQNKL